MMSSREPRPNFVAECIFVRNLSGQNTSFVMIEGETDRAALEQFVAGNCNLFPSKGKDNILFALRSSGFTDVPGIAGIIDLDYTLICDSYERDMPNLLYDDYCPDMESLLLNSPALKKVLRHTFDDITIDEIRDFAVELTNAALGLAMEFGYFRWLNHCRDYGLACNQIRFDEVVDAESLALDCRWVARRLAESNESVTGEQLVEETAELRAKCPPETIQLCRGKDVLAIMALVLPRLYESRFGSALPASAKMLTDKIQLAKELRKAYEYLYFRDTSLFSCIRAWEESNSPYEILKPEI